MYVTDHVLLGMESRNLMVLTRLDISDVFVVGLSTEDFGFYIHHCCGN